MGQRFYSRPAAGGSTSRKLAGFIASHHNKIQFIGYEVANIVFAVNGSLQDNGNHFGLSFETSAALSMLVGSACIWKFDFENNPSMLFVGGIGLTAGGVFLIAAGYELTGLAVAVASLETTRGGLITLCEHVRNKLTAGFFVAKSTRRCLRFGAIAIGWYVKSISLLVLRFQRLGRFINDRPFLTGSLIKAPLRLEFVGKKALEGDVVGVAVGLSWMVLGDGGLAVNDSQLKASLVEYATAERRHLILGKSNQSRNPTT